MKSFNEFLICEARLERLRQHIELHHPIAFVSSDRGELSDEENNKRFQELKRTLKLTNFGYNRVVGGYVEEIGTVVQERSIVIYGSEKDNDKLRNFAIGLGHKFNQDSILFISSKGDCEYISTKQGGSFGKVDNTFKLDNKITLSGIEQYYTKIGHKKFKFKSLESGRELNERVSVVEKQIQCRFLEHLEQSGYNALKNWEYNVKDPNGKALSDDYY